MVSPSKKQKSKSRDKGGHNSKKVSTGGNLQNRSRKPLCNKRFYLDLKSHVTTTKLETNLKSLGATVELFLVQEVNIVVTDRPQWTGGTSGSRSGSTPKCALPSPSQSFHTPSGVYSGSPATLDSPGEGLGRRRTKSRAEAMLERARLQPQKTTIDPLDNAARWGIPIWPLEKIWKWLEKVYEKSKLKGSLANSGTSSCCPKGKKLTDPYIKIESVHGAYRPVYKEFAVWPTINFEFEAVGCPFSPPKPVKNEDTNKRDNGNSEKNAASKSRKHKSREDSRMTRKARPRVHSEECGSAPLSGYCEICQLNYTDRKKHLQTESHIKFVSNDRNFVTLDTFIKQGSNMETFLKMNGANDISQCSLFGNTRRSLRSVVRLHTLDASSPPPSTNTSPWKGLLSPTKKIPIPSVSNGHHATRSKQIMDEKMLPKVVDQKDNLEIQCNGISSPHCYGTRYGGRGTGERTSPSIRRSSHWDEHPSVRARPQRTRTSSASCFNTIDEPQLSPTGSESGHHLRSRGQLWLPSNLLGTTAEDEGNPVRSRLGQSPQNCSNEPQSAQTCRDVKEENPDTVGGDKDDVCVDVSNKIEVKSGEGEAYHGNSQIIKKKRLTPEEMLIEDNKAYYKLEVKNSKLRSSGQYLNQRETTIVLKEEPKPPEPSAPKEVSSTCNGDQGKPIELEKTNMPVKEDTPGPCKKIRLSEISLLNNEAENFMFGEPVRKDSTDESSEEDCKEEENVDQLAKSVKKECIEMQVASKVLSENIRKHDVRHNNKIEENKSKEIPTNASTTEVLQQEGNSQYPCNLQCDESSMGSIDTCSLASSCDTNNPTQKKKRRTHAELFIHDNLDYYKFEIPGSRLRFQGSILPQTFVCKTPTRNENVLNIKSKDSKTKESVTMEACGSGVDISKSKESNNTENEHFNTSASNDKKNDISKERNTRDAIGKNSINTITDEKGTEIKNEECNDKAVLQNIDGTLEGGAVEGLHFSFEGVPQSEPWYQTYQRQDEGEEFYLGCLSDSGYWKPFLLPYEMPPELLHSSAGPSGVAGSSRTLSSNAFLRKKRRRMGHVMDKKPRKSPRCHASTLAILSSLMHHRKRKEPDKKDEDEDDGERKTIPEEDDELSRDDSTIASTSKAFVNAEFTSESDMDMKEIAQNIDKMFMFSENEPRESLPSTLGKEIQGKPIKQKTAKLKKSHKSQGTDTTVKRLEADGSKETEIIDIDPVVLQELNSSAPDSLDCIPQPAVRCKGGPCMDVLTLLDGFSQCHCMDDVVLTSKENNNINRDTQLTPLKESSCNSSECGASSTCDTITYSDVPETLVKIPNRKRKRRKKNLTGWPVEKQKLKKRIPKKVDKTDENLPKNRGLEEKWNTVSEKINNVLIEDNGSVEISIRKESTVHKVRESDKCSNDETNDKSDKNGAERECGKLEDGILIKSDSRDDVLGKMVVVKETNVDRRMSKDASVVNVYSAGIFKTDKHSSISRSLSLDSNTTDLQPCVRVKKIENINEYQFLTSSMSSETSEIANNRRLRSASSSSFSSSPIRKRHCSDADIKSSSSPRRVSARQRSLGGKWDSWSARKRR